MKVHLQLVLRGSAARLFGSLCLAILWTASLAAQTLSVRFIDAPIVPQQAQKPYVPLSPEQRLKWWALSTFGLPSLLVAGPINAGFGTAIDRPREYGPHWDGFAARYGIRLLQVSVNNGIETGMGAAWGEDPRYFRTLHQPFKQRVLNIIDLTFRAYRTDGERHIAYARLSADVASNFLANTWLPPSINDAQSAAWRSLAGIGSKAAGNATREFLPDVVNWLKRKH